MLDLIRETAPGTVVIDVCPYSFHLYHENYWIYMLQMISFKQLREIRQLSKMVIDFDWQNVINGTEATLINRLFSALHEDSV